MAAAFKIDSLREGGEGRGGGATDGGSVQG